MALHGAIQVNHIDIGKWEAVRAGGTGDGDFIYRCKIEYSDTKGYNHKATFFVKHRYGDGALKLMAAVIDKADAVIKSPPVSERTAWADFCELHDLNPYILLD